MPGLTASDMSYNLQIALCPNSDGVRRRPRACILAPVASSNRGHVFSAFGFGLVSLNFDGKFWYQNFEGIDMT